MSEHKAKAPGEIKGDAYKQEQRKPLPAKWAVQAKLGPKWPMRHLPGYLKRKAEEAKRKEAELTNAKKDTTLIEEAK
jgi:hypothetical protein